MGADDTVGADLAGLATVDEVRAALAAEHARCAPGQWVRGHSLEYATFDGVELDGSLVADAVGGAPALLTFFDFHTALATPAALVAAGIDGPRELEGSSEIVCRDGRPTGVLLEPGASALVERVMPQPTDAQRQERRAETLQADGRDRPDCRLRDGRIARDLRRAARVRGARRALRAHRGSAPRRARDALGRARALDALRDERGERWRGGVAKFFIDGVVEPGTAWLEEPDSEGRGLEPLWPDPGCFARAVELFARAGLPVRDARHRRPGGALHARRLSRRRRRSRACATGSSTSRRSATSSSRASRPRASWPRCRPSTCSGCGPTARTRGRGRSAPSAPAGPSLRRPRRERRAPGARLGLAGRALRSARGHGLGAPAASAGGSRARTALARSGAVGRAGAGRLHERGLAGSGGGGARRAHRGRATRRSHGLRGRSGRVPRRRAPRPSGAAHGGRGRARLRAAT